MSVVLDSPQPSARKRYPAKKPLFRPTTPEFMAGENLSLYFLDPVFVRGKYTCAYCYKDLLSTLDEFITMVREHLVPRVHGGTDQNGNVVAACAACDRLKNDAEVFGVEQARDYIEFRRERYQAWLDRMRVAFREDTHYSVGNGR